MKVNGNDPTHTTVLGKQRDFGMTTAELFPDNHSNIPIRLEIASRLLAGRVVDAIPDSYITEQLVIDREVQSVLRIADALIKAHNETCGGE